MEQICRALLTKCWVEVALAWWLARANVIVVRGALTLEAQMNQSPGGTDQLIEISVGSAVMVRTRYLGSWSTGFEVVELLDQGYRIRRLSDSAVLPDVIPFSDVEKDIYSLSR